MLLYQRGRLESDARTTEAQQRARDFELDSKRCKLRAALLTGRECPVRVKREFEPCEAVGYGLLAGFSKGREGCGSDLFESLKAVGRVAPYTGCERN